jgi:hypothetical protein
VPQSMELSNILYFIFLINLVKAVKNSSKSIEIYPTIKNNFLRQNEKQFQLKDISISFVYNNENVILDLVQNEHLIPKDHFLSYQKSNEDTERQVWSQGETNSCHYIVRNLSILRCKMTNPLDAFREKFAINYNRLHQSRLARE